MEALLVSAGVSHLSASFAEEELTLELLRTMASGDTWLESMEELGVDADSQRRLKVAVKGIAAASNTGKSAASSPAAPLMADVAAALAIVASTPAAKPAAAEELLVSEGFNVTHINSDEPRKPPASGALAAYRQRQLQQDVQKASAGDAAPARRPQARYNPAPAAPATTRPIDKFGQGGVVPVPRATNRPDVFDVPANLKKEREVEEHDLD